MNKSRAGLLIVAMALLSNSLMAEPIVKGQVSSSLAQSSAVVAFDSGNVDTAAFASAPKQFFQAIVAKDYQTAWGLLSETTKANLVKTTAKEAKLDEAELRRLFDTNDPSIQKGFWSAFRESCKADVFVNFSYTYGRQVGGYHVVELRRPGSESDKPLELQVFDEGGPKFGMAESFKL